MRFLNYLIFIYGFWLVANSTSAHAAPQPGFLEGHLKIVLSKEVDLSDQTQASDTNYADFPLIVLSKNRKKEIARVSADAKGNYRIALPPGNYILDVKGRAPGHLRAKPEPFKVVSNQKVRVNMTIDTGIR